MLMFVRKLYRIYQIVEQIYRKVKYFVLKFCIDDDQKDEG